MNPVELSWESHHHQEEGGQANRASYTGKVRLLWGRQGCLSLSLWGVQNISALRERRFNCENDLLLCNKLSQNLIALKRNLSISFMVLRANWAQQGSSYSGSLMWSQWNSSLVWVVWRLNCLYIHGWQLVLTVPSDVAVNWSTYMGTLYNDFFLI